MKKMSTNVYADVDTLAEVINATSSYPSRYPYLSNNNGVESFHVMRLKYLDLLNSASSSYLSWKISAEADNSTYKSMVSLLEPDMVGQLFTEAKVPLEKCESAYNKFKENG